MFLQRHRTAILVFCVLAGVGLGLGGYTFIYARGASYLTNDPTACANCHIMRDNYNAWTRSSHHNVAVCNDCHAPHDLVGKYETKALNGMRHSWAFTTGWFHEPIAITPRDRAITEKACRDCHGEVVQMIDREPHKDKALSCLRCHSSVGHMESASNG